MAEDKTLGVEGGFGLGPTQTRAEDGGERAPVDLDPANAGEIKTDEALVGPAQRLDPADHAGPAAVGNDGDSLSGADLKHKAHRLGVGGQQDGVGGGLEAPTAQPGQVDVTASGRVADPVLGGGEDGVGAHSVDQNLGQRLGGGQLEAVQLGGQ